MNRPHGSHRGRGEEVHGYGRDILEVVKQALLVSTTLAAALFGAAACSNANIDNKDAVKSAMVEYLEKNKASTGIDPAAMDVNVDAVQFERDTARATVSFLIKGSTQGMQGNYTLTRDGNKWGNVTRQNITAAPHGVDRGRSAARTRARKGTTAPCAAPRDATAIARRSSRCRNQIVKTVAVLGGGPAGASAAERLARAGLKTMLFDEKLAWEKPCGGGLTYKAYNEYPYLIDNDTPKRLVHETVIGAAKAGEAKMTLDNPLVIYSRLDLNRMLLERAERAGAAIEKTRILNIEQREHRLEPADQTRHRRSRLPDRRHRRPQSAAHGRHRIQSRRHHERAGLLRPRAAGAHRHSVSRKSGRLHLGLPALPAISRSASAAKANPRKPCARGWNATWMSAASLARTRPFTATCSRRWKPPDGRAIASEAKAGWP